jgi:hypothetical protein
MGLILMKVGSASTQGRTSLSFLEDVVFLVSLLLSAEGRRIDGYS